MELLRRAADLRHRERPGPVVTGHLHRAPVAQGQLTAAAGCAVILAVGVAAEAAGPDPAAVTSVADLAVGAAFAGCGLWLVTAGRSWGWLGLATAAGWFTGTAAGAAPWLPAYLGNVAALGYRAFLLHLLACALGLPPASTYRPLILAGYLAVLLPVPADSLATAALIAGLAALAAIAARRAPADRRPAIVALCLSAAALAVIWSLAAASVTGGNGAELANDLALVAAAFVLAAGWARGGWLQGAINALVVELGPSQHPAAPVSALLANALADPELDVRYSVPGLGWFDENGLRVTAPSGEGAGHLTRVATPDGGEVVLVHGPAAAAGPALARAAATAAALAMESARLGAEVRQQADAVRESRRRLLAVADAERQALETRLRAGPVGRLRRVDEALAGIGDQTAHDIRGQAAIALDDLVRLARGLYPGALGTQPFRKVVRDLAEAMPMPVRVVTHGQLAALPEAHQALAYFFCSECLTNVARHSRASSATVRLHVDGERLLISVLDDGQGGATIGRSRGLRGLADRVEVARGQLTVDSPPGGPTCIRADIPLAPPA